MVLYVNFKVVVEPMLMSCVASRPAAHWALTSASLGFCCRRPSGSSCFFLSSSLSEMTTSV